MGEAALYSLIFGCGCCSLGWFTAKDLRYITYFLIFEAFKDSQNMLIKPNSNLVTKVGYDITPGISPASHIQSKEYSDLA